MTRGCGYPAISRHCVNELRQNATANPKRAGTRASGIQCRHQNVGIRETGILLFGVKLSAPLLPLSARCDGDRIFYMRRRGPAF
jgi:hypothetical protein